MKVDEKADIECILDPGSMIIAMSDAVSHQLGIAYDPKISIRMQAANGEINNTLGLAKDVPFAAGGIVLLLQVHVVKSPAYDVLLGRPFDVITQSVVKNYANAEQTVTITDPEDDNRQWTVPTVEQGPPQYTVMRMEKDFRETSRI